MMDKLKACLVAVPIKNEAGNFRINIRSTKIWTEFSRWTSLCRFM